MKRWPRVWKREKRHIPSRHFSGNSPENLSGVRIILWRFWRGGPILTRLLAIHNAIKYPVTYVQGPPGTGKTHTIINSIVTAFFNEKTVLLASYNNHPIDTVVEKLRSIPYGADVLFIDDEDEKVKAFHEYLGKTENVKKFLRIFPVVATSCISSHRIGSPRPYFDITIMDEASQCSTAVSLLPVIRGENLLLVGDPQQLNPVILLDRKDNEILKQRYRIPPEYDYVENSVYKTFLANDAVSEEILLRHHYRCCKSIIEFNNVKYYNSRLKIESSVKADHPLVYVDVKGNEAGLKNTAPREAEEILKFIQDNRDKKIGIITPFANQKECIGQMLKDNKIDDVSCGTVHAFQGDEKDIILFSTALTDQTSEKTYHWLCNNRACSMWRLPVQGRSWSYFPVPKICSVYTMIHSGTICTNWPAMSAATGSAG